MNSTLRFTISLPLLAALALGCGGDDPPQRKDNSNNTANNTANNASNNVTNAPTNNVTNAPTNNVTNTPTNNVTNTPTNNTIIDPMGGAAFVLPADATSYASAGLSVRIVLDADASEAELLLDDSEVLTQFGASNEFEWDTSSVAEGPHELAIRYSLAPGTPLLSEDLRTVIVDRTPPSIRSSIPAPSSDQNSPTTPISLRFDEPMDPASVDATTVTIQFDNGESTTHTASLEADGVTVVVEFAPDSISLPYTATVTVAATDLAGNPANRTLTYTVPAWIGTSIGITMSKLHYVDIGGSEYVIGVGRGVGSDVVNVYKRAGSTWTRVANQSISNVYALAVDTAGDRAHIAVLRRDSASGIIVKAAQLLEFNPMNDSLTPGGSRVLGPDGPGGAIALEVRAAALGTVDALAVVSNGAVSVFEFSNRGLTNQTANTFPTGDYSNVRTEGLAVAVSSMGRPEVIFARCSSATVPCVRTYAERLVKGAGSTWTEVGSASTVFAVGVSNLCDEFTNLEAIYVGDQPTMLFAHFGPCDNLVSRVRVLEGGVGGWTALGNDPMPSMPNFDTQRYSSHLAIGAANEPYGLMAARDRLMVAEFTANGPQWMAPVAASLPTAVAFSSPRLYVDSTGAPVVIFSQSPNIQVWRANQ